MLSLSKHKITRDDIISCYPYPVPLRPTRRLPKKFARKTSGLSRRLALKSVGRGRKKRKKAVMKTVKMMRQWNRLRRSVQGFLRNIWLWFLVVLFFGIVLLVVYFLFSPRFSVQSIRVSRQDRRVDTEEIQTLLSPLFEKHILFISPILIQRDIEKTYPEVSQAHVRRVYPNELAVSLTMDPIVAEVALGSPEETEAVFASTSEEQGKRFTEPSDGLFRYVTDGGVYLEYPFSLPIIDGEQRIRLHFVDWAVKPEHRQQIFDAELLVHMRRMRGILEQSFGVFVPLTTVYLRAKEYHVMTIDPGRPEGEQTVMLWFDFKSSLGELIARYRAFLKTGGLEKTDEYIDLRLRDRIIYK